MILGILAAASVAAAPPLITQPLWKATPSTLDFLRAYPDKPRRDRIGGRAVVQCGVRTDGGMEGCALVSEEPAGLGFGDAALKLTATMVLHPQTRAGADVAGGTIQVPIRFAAPPAPPEGRRVDQKNIVWTERPTAKDLANHYPTQAMLEGVDGRAVVLCRVTQAFTLTACAVVEEEPYGYAFGIAVQFLMDKFKLSPMGKDGTAIVPGDVVPAAIRFVVHN